MEVKTGPLARGRLPFRVRTPVPSTGRRAFRKARLESHRRLEILTSLPLEMLHDALLEDALHKAAAACGVKEPAPSWSAWVRVLRAVLSPRRR